jgi:ABC-type proline/glycine betaine transport system ATPase subunit
MSKTFNSTAAVHQLNLTIEAGEVVVLLGPSGSCQNDVFDSRNQLLALGFDVPR